MLKKILLGLLSLVAVAIVAFQIYVNSGETIQLPAETDQVVEALLEQEEIPELVTGKTGFAENGAVKIWYEAISATDTPQATILLVMGHSASALTWTPAFYQSFVDSGYQVIRYDNRGLGESSWMDNWTEDNAYTLEDMAEDAMAVLDDLGVQQAHVIGASMGGMIAQRIALSHQERVLSLTSIMSSGYWEDPEIATPDLFISKLQKLALKYFIFYPSDANMLKIRVGFREALKGNGGYTFDVAKVAERALYEMKKRKGYNPVVGDQHTAAIAKSGSRLDELGRIKMPTLVIHGQSDPLVFFEHGAKYAPLIPHAQTLFIEGMGHDMPDVYMAQFHAAIYRTFAEVRQESAIAEDL